MHTAMPPCSHLKKSGNRATGTPISRALSQVNSYVHLPRFWATTPSPAARARSARRLPSRVRHDPTLPVPDHWLVAVAKSAAQFAARSRSSPKSFDTKSKAPQRLVDTQAHVSHSQPSQGTHCKARTRFSTLAFLSQSRGHSLLTN